MGPKPAWRATMMARNQWPAGEGSAVQRMQPDARSRPHPMGAVPWRPATSDLAQPRRDYFYLASWPRRYLTPPAMDSDEPSIGADLPRPASGRRR